MGSTLVARRAGSHAAKSVIALTTMKGDAEGHRVEGTQAEELAFDVFGGSRVSGNPRPTPMASSSSDSLRIIHWTAGFCAPSAMRMPISLVRRTTL